MFRIIGTLCALALASVASLPAHAASDADLAQIRAEIDALKGNYEARIRALEDRLRNAEAATAQAAAAPAPPPAPAVAARWPPPSEATGAPSAGASAPTSRSAL